MKKSLSEKGNAMLVEWQRTSGKDATMEALLKALKKIGMGHLMEKAAGIQTHEIGIKLKSNSLYYAKGNRRNPQSKPCKHSQKSLFEYSFFLAESHYFKKDCRRLPVLPRKELQ